jgi:DNA-directed RNA polymerase specialized sigma24 family protein
MTKLTIPQIREEVQKLTAEGVQLARRQLEINARIDALMQETYRRSYSRAPVTSRRITPAVRLSVLRMSHDLPDASHQEIATAHDINIGRVSEILHGKL